MLAAAEARALRADGVDVRIVTGPIDGARWSAALAGTPVTQYEERGAGDLFAWTVASRYRLQAARAERVLRDHDVIIAHNYPCNALLGAMSLDAVRLWQVNEPPRTLYLPDTAPVLSARADALGADAPDWTTRQFAQRLARWRKRVAGGGRVVARRTFDGAMSARLDGLYAISRYSQAITRRIYGRCSDTIVYPAIGQDIAPPPARDGIRRDAFEVLVQSRLEPIKNVETVLRGFAAFATAHRGAHMHVVGEGSDYERLRELSNEIARDRVSFHHFLDNTSLATLAARCDAFALVPIDEPFGMVFTEAMARGLLCVGPDHGGPTEILDNGTLGWTVNAFAPQAVADALQAIADLPTAVANHCRESARASVAERFSNAAMVASLRAVLREHGVQ